MKWKKSPEAQFALSVFEAFYFEFSSILLNCSSGKELIERNFKADVELASQLNCSHTIPTLHDDAYINL